MTGLFGLEIDTGHALGLQDVRALQKIGFHHQSIHILNQLLILTTSLCLLFGSSSNYQNTETSTYVQLTTWPFSKTTFAILVLP